MEDEILRIKNLLGEDGVCLWRTDEYKNWFVHCWMNDGTEIYCQYVDDLHAAISDVLKLIVLRNH